MTRWARRDRAERAQISQEKAVEEPTSWAEMFKSLKNSNLSKANPEDIEEDITENWEYRNVEDVEIKKGDSLEDHEDDSERKNYSENNAVKRKFNSQDSQTGKGGSIEKTWKKPKLDDNYEPEKYGKDIYHSLVDDDDIPSDGEDSNSAVVDKFALRLMGLEKLKDKQEEIPPTEEIPKKVKREKKVKKQENNEIKETVEEKVQNDQNKKKEKKKKIKTENVSKESSSKRDIYVETKPKKGSDDKVNGEPKVSQHRVYHPYLKIGRFAGFEVLVPGVHRLRNLAKALRKKGMAEEEMQHILKLERRKEENKLRRAMEIECLCCREKGHTVSQCPKAEGGGEFGMGICFRCGSTEHTIKKCKAKLSPGSAAYPYAQCYICNETGHLAQTCPKNTRGIFPHGGGCHRCGSVNHRKGECPTFRKGGLNIEEEEDITLPLATTKDNVEFEEDSTEVTETQESKSHKKRQPKSVEF